MSEFEEDELLEEEDEEIGRLRDAGTGAAMFEDGAGAAGVAGISFSLSSTAGEIKPPFALVDSADEAEDSDEVDFLRFLDDDSGFEINFGDS